MKCLGLFVVTVMTLLAGCATHYCKQERDTLVLYLNKPGAQQVFLASSLDGFEPHQARHLDGRWVVVLPSGDQFRYYYVVDDKIFLPPCKIRESDDFGSENCVFDPQLPCF
jgi:ABC-type uncharacterized transport system auxiliary subunit